MKSGYLMRWQVWMAVTLAAAAGGLMLPSPVCAQNEHHSTDLHTEDCPGEEMEKGDLCGFARAAIARIEAEQAAQSAQDGHDAKSDGGGPVLLLADGPDDTDVTHCFLDIEVTLPPNAGISGSNTLSVTSRTDGLDQFTLDLYRNMTVHSVLVDGSPASFTRPTDKIVIDLGTTYNAGQSFQIKVTYSGLPDSSGSMTNDAFTFKTHSGNSIVASLSQPFFGHRWWPCKENRVQLDDKFTMDLWVTAPGWMTVASNGLLQGTDTLSGGRRRTRWRSNYENTVYGVSVAMTNYARTTWSYNYPGGSMPVELYLYPETEAASLAQLSNLVEMIETLSDPGVFGQYPFINEKYGIAQFNTNYGLEHQTITSQGNFVERRNVHELAHSWWGNSITCKSWHHIWVNEGWATYGESLYYERRPGGSHAAYLAHMNARRPSPGNYGGVVYRSNISTTSAIFNQEVVYYKGQWVLHMLRHVLGDSVFFQTLATYRSLYEGGTAGIDDYQAVVESVSGRDMDWFFNEWIYAGGAPYYEYGWEPFQSCGQHYLRLYVRQYQTWPAFSMPIDIRIETAAGTQTQVIWNDDREQWYQLPVPAPVTGVAFDPDTWILRGAADPVAYKPGPPPPQDPPRLIAAEPGPGAVLTGGLTQIVLQFDEAITFTAGDFRLADAGNIPVPLSVAYDPEVFTVTLTPAAPLDRKVWTVSVKDTVRTECVALDGELGDPPALPSGDGTPGGDAVYSFVLAFPGDFDLDFDLDGADLAHLLACLSPSQTSPPPGCQDADLDGDGDADQSDFGLFQRCMTAQNVPPSPDCIGA